MLCYVMLCYDVHDIAIFMRSLLERCAHLQIGRAAMTADALLCYVVCYVMSRYNILCYTMLCDALSCYAMSWYVMSCYVM